MSSAAQTDDLAFLAGGGEMGALIRAKDWSGTSLGPPLGWSQSLRTAVRLMLNTRHPMYIFWGVEGACLYNDAFRPSIGSERHPGSLGRPALEVWSEVWAAIGPQIEQVMAGHGATWHENQLIPMTRNGRREDVYWTYSYGPIDDETDDNGVGGVLVVCSETTEQVAMGARLLASQERLELALGSGRGIGTWDWDVGADRVVADARFAQLYGVDPTWAAVGAPIAEFFTAIHPDDLITVRGEIAGALATGEAFSSEYRLVQGDGSVRWVVAEGRCELAADGTPLRFPGVSFDITDRKTAEAELRRLNAELERQVLERASERGTTWNVSPLLLSVIELATGRFARVNPAWTLTLGWSEAEMTGAEFLDFLHPDDVAASQQAFAEVLAGRPVLGFENRYRGHDGAYRWLSWVAVPEGGKLYSTSRDITAEKASAQQLADAQEQLRQSQKMEALGQLTGGLAHDFNNLMTIIRSSTDLLRRVDLPEERRRRYIDAISDTVDRASGLTRQLLAFARRQPLAPQVFDVGVQVKSIGELIRPLVGGRVTIEVEANERDCFALADLGQFESAMLNLAVNGRDAMDGEGRLVLRVRPADQIPHIRAHPSRRGSFVAVSVQDTGCGIPADKLEAIFEPFYTTKEIGKGTGLGLSQAFGFAKQSGGEIAVTSTVGEGSTFTLFLPAAAAPERGLADVIVPRRTAAANHGRCILVVEDDRAVGEFSTELLHDLGYRTRWLPSAQEALDVLGEDASAFDLVFTDVIMPGMNGIDLALTIRSQYPQLPVILTSGYSDALADDGAHGFELIQKPYSVEVLARTLRRTMG